MNFRHSGDITERDENGVGHVTIEADQGDGFGGTLDFATAEGEGGDIYAEAAKNCADLADDAGNVAVAKKEHGAVQRRLELDAVQAQDAREGVVKDGAFDRDAVRLADEGRGGDFDGVRKAVLAAAGEFFDAEAAAGGDSAGIDEIHLLVEHGVQHTGKNGVAEDAGAELGGFTGIADADKAQAAGSNLGGERTQAFGEKKVGPEAAVLLG